MITEDLIEYIQVKRRKNISDDEIKSHLVKAGWHNDDIDEGFKKLIPPLPVKPLPNPIAPAPIIPISQNIQETPIIPIADDEIVKTKPTSYIIPGFKKEEPIAPPKPIEPTSFSPQSPSVVKPVFSGGELMPTLKPKNINTVNATTSNDTNSPIPKGALLSTLSGDILAREVIITEEPVNNNKKKLVLWLVIILIISAIGGTVFAMMTGHISFVKKDPKIALLNTYQALNSLGSYTSLTSIDISSPSVANITNGLVSGASINSIDRDSLSIDVVSKVNHNKNSLSRAISDYALSIRSSLLKNEINSDIKYDGTTAFVTIPDLHKILSVDAPLSGIVSIKNNQFDSLLSLVPDNYKTMAQSKDTYKILQNGIPPFVSNTLQASIKEYTNTVAVTEKLAEDIHGTSTYHYLFTSDHANTKKLLMSLVNMFALNLSDAQIKNIDEATGAAKLDTFEVWVGKSDNMVHQYKFSLSVPLSKVINLDDKGIDGNLVKINWQTTFYDLGTTGVISIPENSTPVDTFVKLTLDQKMKVLLSSFAGLTKTLHNALGSFGNRPNLGGSCTNPSSGSLFSPLGHSKGASTSVGSIASAMNELLAITNNVGSCFSTPTAWAIALPLASDPISLYCVDSTGRDRTISAPITGPTCK